MSNTRDIYDDRLLASSLIENTYFMDIGQFFGLSKDYIQRSISQMGGSKHEKKRLKQTAGFITKNSYYEYFSKNDFDVNLIHNTPLYKRLIRERFWSDSLITSVIQETNFGAKTTFVKQKEFCCEALTMLLYAYSSMAILFFDHRLIEVLTKYPTWISYIFQDSSKIQDVFNKDYSNDTIHIDYVDSPTLAGTLMTVLKDTWIYDYIVSVSARSTVVDVGFPETGYVPGDLLLDIKDVSMENINTVFSSLTLMLSLMLHSKRNMIFIGNLPNFMIGSKHVLPYISITPQLLENYGKMFWHDSMDIKNTDEFINATTPEFSIKDGKICYTHTDLYNDGGVVAYIPPEKWIYASGTLHAFEEVYNPEPMRAKLHTIDIGEYINYVATDLNGFIEHKDFSIGSILDKYNYEYYVSKRFDLAFKPNYFTMEDDIENSKQFKIFVNPIKYKLETELGPNLLLRTCAAKNETQRQIILNRLNDATIVLYKKIFLSNVNVDSFVCNRISVFDEVEDEDTIIDQLTEMVKERILSYFAFIYNEYVNISQLYRKMYYTIFMESIYASPVKVIANGLSNISENHKNSIDTINKTIEETNQKLDTYINKYKKSRSENNELERKLRDKIKDYEKLKKALSESTKHSEFANRIEQLEAEIELLKKEPARLNQIIAKQKSHIESIENKQSSNEQYERRIKQLEEELARKDKLIQSIEEDYIEDSSTDNLTDEEKYILANLKVDFTVWDCESTRRLQKTLMTNSNFNFIQKSKTETTQFNLSKNADIYVLATNVISHSDSRRWQQLVGSRTDRSVYSPTNGYNSLCQIVLNKYYSLVEKGLIKPIQSTI